MQDFVLEYNELNDHKVGRWWQQDSTRTCACSAGRLMCCCVCCILSLSPSPPHPRILIVIATVINPFPLSLSEQVNWGFSMVPFGPFKHGAVMLVTPESVKQVLKTNFDNYVKGAGKLQYNGGSACKGTPNTGAPTIAPLCMYISPENSWIPFPLYFVDILS